MPDELKSFLVSVSIILAVALFVPCIESVVRLVRRNNRVVSDTLVAPEPKPSKRFTREAA
jgi:hypothetical protein